MTMPSGDIFQEALALHQAGHLPEAEMAYRKLLAAQPEGFNLLQLLGTVLAQQQHFDEAAGLLRRAIDIDPSLAAVHHNYANVLQSLRRHEEALAAYARALVLKPAYPDALVGMGDTHKALGHWQEALEAYESALVLQPLSASTHLGRGNMLRSLGRNEDALKAFQDSLDVEPGSYKALYNRANSLLELKRYREALEGFDASIAAKPDSAEAWNNRGNALQAMGKTEQAIEAYDRAIAVSPNYAGAWFNRGKAFADLRLWEKALECYEEVLRHDPGFAEAYNGRGVALIDMQQLEPGLAAYEQALALRPDYVEALHNLGDAFLLAKRFKDAAAAYERAWSFDADNKYVLGAIYDCWHHCCDWTDHEATRERIVSSVREGEAACSPFVFLSLSQDPADQLACSSIYREDRHPDLLEPLWSGERYKHQRVRIAYLSADFHNHATAFLMAELFELHDREQFELFAYSFGPEREGEMRPRLERSFDHFFDVADLPDREIAELIRAAEIDIAVDLKGFTLHCRPSILAHRPAPVQVNYLGYPGTMGAPYIDYILADPVVIPPGHEQYYAEKVVRLPDSYQVNDRHRTIAPTQYTRTQLGLPEDGFVFCCFNNNYKITPDVFDVWMRLLLAVPRSVLWLLADNEEVPVNLRREAEARGVSADRIVFAPRMPLPEHLARHRCADLFLDTLPYNAHTTTSDALWAGLPVLTCIGRTFAGRVAASLLTAAGMPELIAETTLEYEALALRLATDPAELARLRKRLASQIGPAPLFDTDRFRHHLELAYFEMHKRQRMGLAPVDFDVPSHQGRLRRAQPVRLKPGKSISAHCVSQEIGQSLASPPMPLAGSDWRPLFRDGTNLLQARRFQKALTLLDQAAIAHPAYPAIHGNRAACLFELGRYGPAGEAARTAVALDPAYSDGWNNLGSALIKLRDFPQALKAFEQALVLQPGSIHVLNNMGVALTALNRHGEAALKYAAVRRIAPDYRGIHSSEVFALSSACIWPGPGNDLAGEARKEFLRQSSQEQRVFAPFVMLALTDDPVGHRAVAERYVQSRYPAATISLGPNERYKHKRIRVAYLSADFHNHATAFLMAELFELHDRERFEVYAYSFGVKRDEQMRPRLERSFDHFFDVADLPDREIAELIRAAEIDIAVDLKGFTQDCRPSILAHRPAPVQVNYLGYPGTMGAPYIDYILADPVVIPPGHEQYYAEKVVRLPDSYQVNDRHRTIAPTQYTRTQLGLPEDGFVFCCFNNNYKITPDVFDVWMRLLLAVPRSVLWLLADNEEVPVNLRREAEVRGVSADRIVFAPRMPLPEHLARHRCADLFLDTLPCNAHTTASDALWVGLPVLTCIGKTFAGRVAASLLTAAGLPELIADFQDEYEAKALRLASHPQSLQVIREGLAQCRLGSPLFDTDRFRVHIEKAFLAMHQAHESGCLPNSFDVQPEAGASTFPQARKLGVE